MISIVKYKKMLAGREMFLSRDGEPSKYPTLEMNILETRNSHDKMAGGCNYCFEAREGESKGRSILCKISFFESRVGSFVAKVVLEIFKDVYGLWRF